MTVWSEEVDRNDGAWRLQLRMDRVLHQEKTEFQDMVLFENPCFGRVLALDGIVQTTEGDEYFYHEMLVHVPLLAQGRAEQVLIVGGGDGGALEEVFKHRSVEQATLVEIDPGVVAFARRHLQGICGRAFDDPRLELVFADGKAWVKQQKQTRPPYDVILIDSTDPVGPGEVLFTEDFYRDCAALLAEDGLLVTQNAVPFTEPDSLAGPLAALGASFARVDCYRVAVPSFFGGEMVFTQARQATIAATPARDSLERRFTEAALKTRYYTPEIHLGAFALPPYLSDLMASRPTTV